MAQSMFRIQKDKSNPYVMVNKQFLNDKEISWKAKGVLTYLLSLPDDWKIYEDEICKHSKDGKESLKTAIKELISNGYITRERIRDEKGRLKGYQYSVYEVSTKSGKPVIGKSNNGKLDTTNNDLTNNNSTNNDKYLRHLEELNDAYIDSYLFILSNYGIKHKRVSDKNLEYIRKSLMILKESGVDYEMWKETAREHIDNLPKSNDGDIIAFLKASKRYFEIELE